MNNNRKTTVLLVDDNKHLVITLSDDLIYEGFNVESARNSPQPKSGFRTPNTNSRNSSG
jgi:hypothetical protein